MTTAALVESIRHVHRHPWLVAKASTVGGRLALLASAAALLWPFDQSLALQVVPLAGLVAVRPQIRNLALSLVGIGVVYRMAADKQTTFLDPATSTAAMLPLWTTALWLALLYACYRAAKAYPALPGPVRRHPQMLLHGAMWVVLAGAWFIPRDATGGLGTIRLAAACAPFFIWRCGYVWLSGRRGTAASSAFHDHLFYLGPVWGGSTTPYGKGLDGLRAVSAETPAAIARSQLAGVKLLWLAWMWAGVGRVLSRTAHGETWLALPPLSTLIAAGQAAPVAMPVAWASVFVNLTHNVLALAITGHVIIGSLRLCGFYAFRNTYKPLLSESLVEFWNRYYYFFKELVAEFFFYPTYATWFRDRPALRLYAAVFAAACLGNTYYHVLIDLPELAAAGVAGALRLVAPRAFYTLLLAVGICVSMRRQRALRGSDRAAPSWTVRLRRISGVWLFFALINIWNVAPMDLSFADRTAFFLSLLGWR